MSSQPAWLQPATPPPGSAGGGAPQNDNAYTTNSTSGAYVDPNTEKRKEIVKYYAKVMHLGIVAMLGATAVIAISNIGEVDPADTVSELFICLYMLLFATLLCLHELSTLISGLKSLDDVLRRNLGFLYGVKGKAGFLIFVAFLCFGVSNAAGGLAIGTGAVMVFQAVVMLAIYLRYPELTDG